MITQQGASDDHRRFMAEAIRLSIEKMVDNHGGPFGAVIVRDGEIVSNGYNCVTSRNDPTSHAEIVAIRNACTELNTFQLLDCQLFTSCEPCPMCLGAIYWARLKDVFYACTRDDAASFGFDDRFIYGEVSQPTDQRQIAMLQILREEAMEAFRRWDAKEDRTQY